MRAINQRNLTFGSHLSLEIQEVSEQESKEVQAQVKKQQEATYGWKTFHAEKRQIQKIERQLYSSYLVHRRNLCQTLKEFCIESGNETFNYSKLLSEQNQLSKKEAFFNQDVKISTVEEKEATIEKIISDRRIKMYYKNNHQVNYQDQFDPEADQIQIYKIYEDAFLKDKKQQFSNPYQRFQNTHFSQFSPSQRQLRAPPSLMEVYQPKNEYSIDPLQIPYKQKVNFLKVNDPYIGLQHDLSFESGNNQQYYPENNEIFDSFAINIVDKYDANSEGGKEIKNKFQKEDDILSHKDDLYKNFVVKQNQQLQRQKMRVQQLTDKAFKVLNNGDIEEQDQKIGQANQQEDKLGQFKYLLGQIIETFSVSEVLKFLIKFKSFEVLSRLYEHASEYYGQLIEFQEPLKASYMSQIVQSTMPQQKEQGIKVIINNLFGDKQEISYDQFLQKLTPSINQLDYNVIEESSISSHTYKPLELAIRLFTVWIEFDYFQCEIKKLLEANPNIVQRFMEEATQDEGFSILKICDFMAKSKKNKLKRLKTEIFFRKIVGQKLNLSQFYRWISIKKPQISPSKKQQVEEKYQYYYNLY